MEDVVQFLNVLVTVYILTMLAYVLTSWFRVPYSLRPIQRFLYEVCEPYLRLWRRLPLNVGPLDLTPMVAILALVFGWRILSRVLLSFD